MHSADAKIVGVHACAGRTLIEHHQLLTFLETPQRRGKCTDVHRLCCYVEKMRKQASNFAKQHTDQLPAARDFEAEQLLRSQAECVLLIHRRNIVEPVEIADRLQVGLVFNQLFSAAMKKADVRIDAADDFAVEFQHETKHAMGRGMLGTEIDREVAKARSRHDELVVAAPERDRKSARLERDNAST